MSTLVKELLFPGLSEEIEEIRSELKTYGIHLRASRDFERLAAFVCTTDGRAELHEQFDPSGDMDGAKDAFWIAGFDENGELLHTQAAHLLDLTASNVSRHIAQHLSNYFPKSPPVGRNSIRANPGPKSRKLDGMVAYHGEMWIAPRIRNRTISSLLIRFGLLMIMKEWNPDSVFGLMNWKLATKGFNMRIGYTHAEPMALSWQLLEGQGEHQVWLVYLEREDLNFLRGLPVIEFASMLALNN